MVAVSEHVSCLRGILVVILSLDRADCDDFRLNKANDPMTHSHTGLTVSWFNKINQFRIVFWDVLPCKMIVDRRFRGAYCLHHP
jgi:hypothetical protein